MGERFRCRHVGDICLPCNQVVNGFCGIDGRQCKVERLKLCVV